MIGPWPRLVRAAAGLLLAAAPGLAAADAPPAFEAVRSAHRPSDRVLLDRYGAPLQAVRIDASVRRLDWEPLAAFSPALRELLVQAEDQRYWSHGGVDWMGMARGAWASLGRGTQGASTLTMQLAALLDPALSRPAGGRSLAQKWDQTGAARALERDWSKAQILEAYLNRVPLRGELVGMPAAAWVLMGKHVSGLDRAEAALLVALLRAPNARADRVVRRACALLGQPGVCEAVAVLAERALAGTPRAATPRVEPLAPHYARRWLSRHGGAAAVAGWPEARWRTTIDAGIQRQALALLREQMAELQGRQVEDGAVVVLDNASGEVLAWIGSSGARWSDAAQVDAVLARRQPGSTIKPFVYALAFDQGLATPASLLHDAPADLDGGSGAYMPRNYDHRYRGWVSARTALAASLNVPTARLAALLGPQALFDHLQSAGLEPAYSGGHHGLALALGSADVTLLQLTNAYRMLANGGRWSPVAHDAAQATPARRVFTPATAFQVGDILADAGARAPTFGLDSALVTRGWAAVKTGTSKDMRDNWCVGYTDRYTVGVWIGNARGEPMHRVSGTQGAAPVWRSLVQALHARVPSRPPAPPATLVARQVEFDGALEPSRIEWLARESETSGAKVRRVRAGEQIAGRRVIGIDAPRDGTIVALDPDMPAAVQRMALRGEPGQWWLDGRLLGQGAQLDWRPWPGHHRLELRDARGRTIDEVAFEVRGARLAR